MNILNSVNSILLSLTGLKGFVTILKEQPALIVLLLCSLALTLVWMVRLFPKTAAFAGMQFGGIAMGFIKLWVGIAVAVTVLGWILGLAVGSISGSLSNIWLIGDGLGAIFKTITGSLMAIVVPIAVGIYVLRNKPAVFGPTEPSGVNYWQAKPGKGLEGVSWLYVIFGILIPAFIICHPSLNASTYFIPAALSGAVGIFALIWTTVYPPPVVAKQVSQQSKVEPLVESDGSWICRNKGTAPVLDKDGNPVRNAEGRIKGVRTECAFLNSKEARHCQNPLCGAPNPHWQICEECGFARLDGKGFPRVPDKTAECPNCGHVHPVVPRTRFHLPSPAEKPEPTEEPEPETT